MPGLFVEAIIAAQIGDTEKAIRYGMAALLMDLADVGGNLNDGCHMREDVRSARVSPGHAHRNRTAK
jgi:trehalose/maltose hydrolase-like predicted phosphorylase